MGTASQTTVTVEVQGDPSYACYSCGEHSVYSPASADTSHAKENTFRAKQEEVQQQDSHCQLFSKKDSSPLGKKEEEHWITLGVLALACKIHFFSSVSLPSQI